MDRDGGWDAYHDHQRLTDSVEWAESREVRILKGHRTQRGMLLLLHFVMTSKSVTEVFHHDSVSQLCCLAFRKPALSV